MLFGEEVIFSFLEVSIALETLLEEIERVCTFCLIWLKHGRCLTHGQNWSHLRYRPVHAFVSAFWEATLLILQNRWTPWIQIDPAMVIMACSDLLTRQAPNDFLTRLSAFSCFASKALVVVVGAWMIDGVRLGCLVAAIEWLALQAHLLDLIVTTSLLF